MSDAQQTIAAVLCNWALAENLRCIDIPALSADIDAALGTLTREVSRGTRMCSYPGSGACEGKHHGRWVSGWTPQDGE